MVGDDTNGGDHTSVWCPACGNQHNEGDRCSFCGRSLDDETADRLRLIAHRRHEVELVAAQAHREIRALDDERFALLKSSAPSRSVARGAAGERDGVTGEWRPEVLSDVLVWLGAALLALAALTFVAVAFTRLSSSGRTVLMGVTALVPFVIAVGLRRRLPHTADAVYVLSVVFIGIAGGTGRHIANAPHVSGLAWLAGASAVVALLNAIVGRWIGFASARAVAAIALVVSAAATAYTLHGSHARLGSSFALAAAVIVGVAAGARASQLWRRGPYAALVAGALLLWLVACGFAAQTLSADHRRDAAAAAAVALLGVAPLTARLLRRRLDVVARGLVVLAAAVAAVAGAVIVLIAGRAHGDALAVWVALVGAAVVAAGAAWPDDDVALPVVGVGAVGLGAAVLSVLGAVVVALLQPLGWVAKAWKAPATMIVRHHLSPNGGHVALDRGVLPAVVLAIAAAALLGWGALRRRNAIVAAPEPAVGVLLAAALGYAVVAAGATAAVVAASMAVAASVALVGACAALRWGAPRVLHALVWVAFVSLPLVIAMSIAVRSIAVATTAAAALVFAATAWFAGSSRLRTAGVAGSCATGLVCVGTVVATYDVARATVGLFVAIAAAALIAVAALVHASKDDRVSAVATAHLGAAVGIALCTGTPVLVATSITVVAVAHAIGALRWAPYRWIAPATAVVATWAWLVAANVRVPEAYTLPAAAVMLIVGFVARREPETSSWLTFAPGLLLAFAPTLALTIQHSDVVRSVPLTLVALAVVAIGARTRVQAPVVIGAATLVALGIDLLGPVAARWPRWIALGIAGVALLWLGATAERRLHQARAWSQTFGAFR